MMRSGAFPPFIPLRRVHDGVCQVDQHQHCVPPEHALLELPPVAGPLCLDHPHPHLLGQLGQLLGVGDSRDLALALGALLCAAD